MYMNMKKISVYSLLLPLLLALASCTTDIIGGSVNSTEPLDMSTYDYLLSQKETAVVAEIFDKAGLKDEINAQDVTVIAPSIYAVNRYVRRKNFNYRAGVAETEFKIADMPAEDLAKMSMYIFKGSHWRESIPEDGLYLTALDGTTEVYLTLDPTNTDPGAAYDGGNTAGYGFQYSNFLESTPMLIHALFKRGENWEHSFAERKALSGELDNPECDQFYRMYVSDVRTKNGVVHVLYSSDATFSEHYFYHSLIFYGTRNDDK